ncbi:uncharacterized protein LOC116935164 isoform X2 [Daphnia magna]|uniref:uncharacterized protein LOC116935164 isoform X2 n=2 Tax=Daphnia magna TaxID=35525 RepID=UPI001E1BD8ED|nr:uncharacterized protein LOC116935164 isoform X2 [Daphnia magna]
MLIIYKEVYKFYMKLITRFWTSLVLVSAVASPDWAHSDSSLLLPLQWLVSSLNAGMASLAEEVSILLRCSSQELKQHLTSKGYDHSTATTFLEQEIDGETFLGLTAANLGEIGLKFGPKLKLTAYIARLKEAQPETSPVESLKNGCPTEEKDMENQNLVNEIVSAIDGGEINDWEVVIREFHTEDADNSTSSSSTNSGTSAGSISTSGVTPSGTNSTNNTVTNDPTPTNGATSEVEIGKIDVIKLLQQSAKGKEILENFNEREKPFLKDCEREEITRIVVADVVSKIGHLYPSTDTKEHMGASITNAFTCLKINRPGVSNYCHFYNRKTGGFIDTRLKTLRRSQSPSKRKRCSTKKPEKGEDKGSKRKNDAIATVLDESTMFKIRWLQSHPSIPQNRTQILQYMNETFECRQTMIETDLKSATLVLEKFPRFTDFDHGFLIINEFLTKYPSSGAFEDNFLLKLSSKIREVAIIEKITVPVKCSDDCLTSLMQCLLLFPAIRRIRRESQTMLLERFFII